MKVVTYFADCYDKITYYDPETKQTIIFASEATPKDSGIYNCCRNLHVYGKHGSIQGFSDQLLPDKIDHESEYTIDRPTGLKDTPMLGIESAMQLACEFSTWRIQFPKS